MSKFYTNLTNHESGTVQSIQNFGDQYGISISQDIDAKVQMDSEVMMDHLSK